MVADLQQVVGVLRRISSMGTPSLRASTPITAAARPFMCTRCSTRSWRHIDRSASSVASCSCAPASSTDDASSKVSVSSITSPTTWSGPPSAPANTSQCVRTRRSVPVGVSRR